MMNLVSEIAQYAIETDQVIRELAQQRDDLKRVVDAQDQEIKSLRRRLDELNPVRFPDRAQDNGQVVKEAI